MEYDAVPNYAFAFNDSNFSDRVLRIEVMTTMKLEDRTASITDWARHKKRRRAYSTKDEAVESAIDYSEDQEEQLSFNSQNEAVERVLDEAVMPELSPSNVILLSPPADDCPSSKLGLWIAESNLMLRVRTLQISSAILASKSPFFYKVFSTGMKEPENKNATLRTSVSEDGYVHGELGGVLYKGFQLREDTCTGA